MRVERIIKNAFCGILHKFICLILKFVLRAYMIKCLGNELVGLDSVLLDWMSMLNVASLGIEVAIQYSLYNPIAHNDNDKIARIVRATQCVYKIISIIILVSGIILMPFINFMVKDRTYSNWYVFSAYLIMLFGVSGSYLWCYKRTILQAFEEVYIINIIDIITETIFTLLDIAALIIFKNLHVYILLYSVKAVCQHFLVAIVCDRRHAIKKLNFRYKDEEKNIVRDLKDVAPLKLANYVYGFTDNIIISKFLGLAAVTLYSNYMLIVNSLFSVSTILVNSTKASFGIKLSQETNKKNIQKNLDNYIFVQFVVAGISSILLSVIIKPFINIWLNKNYVISDLIMLVMAVELFTRSMYQPLQMVFEATGSFKQDKVITIAASIINIVISIILVFNIGMAGAVAGTLVTDLFVWVYRAKKVQLDILEQNTVKCILKWSVKVMSYLAAFTISYLVICRIDTIITSYYMQIFVNGIVSTAIFAVIMFICFNNSDEWKYMINLAAAIRNKILRRTS